MRHILVIALVACVGCRGRMRQDAVDVYGMTALMHAAQRGDSALAAQLIAAGADVNATVMEDNPREFLAFAKLADPLPRRDIGMTPLMYAVRGGHVGVAKVLVAHRAGMHAAMYHEAPLTAAIRRDDIPMLRVLLSGPTRPSGNDMALALEHKPETFQFLLQHRGSANALGAPTKEAIPTPLVIQAAIRNDFTKAQMLLDAGADPNARNKWGWGVLRVVRPNHPDRVRMIGLFKKAGARDDSAGAIQTFFDAIYGRRPDDVRRALQLGVSPNTRDFGGTPALNSAAAGGDTAIVRILVQAGADVNVVSEYGSETPLLAAIDKNRINVVRVLLDAGAPPDQRDRFDRTPLQVAKARSRGGVVALLEARLDQD